MPAPETSADAALVARPALCPRCGGRGTLPAVSCGLCAFREGLEQKASGSFPQPFARAWYHPTDLAARETFPACGHEIGVLLTERGAFVCPRCDGAGEVAVRRTALAWARRDRREARQKKRAASERAKVLSENGPALGFSVRRWRDLIRFIAPKCEAHCRRTGKPCPCRVVLGNMRCRRHGGLSTGPTTAEGRARISQSSQRRARREAEEKTLGIEGNKPC